MLKTLLPLVALGALALTALPAAAQSGGPTPKEQVGIHTGTQTTNGSAVMVTDQNGIHPEGYPGMAVRNRASGDPAPAHHRHHRKHHETTEPAPG
ncbi:MAG TPA: hypothetical protein VHN39_10645 [Phenylobacterium sp.]|nr:hypothetical protein [Phenylobacterium sp.]